MVEKKKITCKAGQCWHAQCLHFAREGRTACRELSDSFPAPGIRGQTRKLGAQSGLIHRDCPGQGWGSRRREGEEGSSAPSVSASPGLPVHLWAPGAGPTRGERKRLQREWDVALLPVRMMSPTTTQCLLLPGALHSGSPPRPHSNSHQPSTNRTLTRHLMSSPDFTHPRGLGCTPFRALSSLTEV